MTSSTPTLLYIDDDPALARLVERDHVDAAFAQPVKTARAAWRMHDFHAVPGQTAVDQACQRIVVVDIEQRW